MNRLSETTSPYLIQHANNPVNWFPWGQEALAKARAEDKPIFLSIGYAACHWCHVMAHESFEDPETAMLMNENFVNIKVDREERPDLDAIYMHAVSSMTGSGGWPMSVFLTPELKPFYAGTYFPPTSRYNLPGFKDLLRSLTQAWKEKRSEITRVSNQVLQALDPMPDGPDRSPEISSKNLNNAVNLLVENYDWEHGGWGGPPRFPQSMALNFLIVHACLHKDQKDKLISLVEHCLKAMARGGMYDVLGGGFARYSTDTQWLIPHFEKMLYDNALLSRTYLHAWLVTGNQEYKQIAANTIDFVIRELAHPSGGFYSSLDADSEGVEGKYYVWTSSEILETLADQAPLFESAYGISSRGNWEGQNILQRALDDDAFSVKFKSDPIVVKNLLAECHKKLFSVRSNRLRPATDEKIISSWNGLMLVSLAEAARFMDEENLKNKYYSMATRNALFYLDCIRSNGSLFRSWREGKFTSEVFLEDFAGLILGLLELYQTDFDNRWYFQAQELADELIRRFEDPQRGFFDTPADGEKLIVRPRELMDQAIPSGNSLACEALLKLASFTNNSHYREKAESSLRLVGNRMNHNPLAFAHWLEGLELSISRGKQIAILGRANDDTFNNMISLVRTIYMPNSVTAAATYPPPEKSPSLLADKPLINNMTTAYVCEEFVCREPVTELIKLKEKL